MTKDKYEAALNDINSYNAKYMEDMTEVRHSKVLRIKKWIMIKHGGGLRLNYFLNKNAFQSKAHLPLANRKSNTYNLTL